MNMPALKKRSPSMFPPVRRRKDGFTLIEVLLVLVILAVLASLAVMAYGPIQRRANVNAAKSQIGLFKPTLDAFQMDVGTYPSTAQGLESLMAAPADLPNPAKWGGPYIDSLPIDPWGNRFQYVYPGTRRPDSYDVWSCGPDGVSGTEDDIGNWN
jgi:general secretion pathway protein G